MVVRRQQMNEQPPRINNPKLNLYQEMENIKNYFSNQLSCGQIPFSWVNPFEYTCDIIQQAQNALNNQQNRISDQNQNLSQFSQQLQQKQSENVTLNDLVWNLRKEINRLLDINKQITKELQILQETYDQLPEGNDQDFDQLQENFDQLKKAHKELNERKEYYKKKNEEQNYYISKLVDERKNMQQILTEKETKMNEQIKLRNQQIGESEEIKKYNLIISEKLQQSTISISKLTQKINDKEKIIHQFEIEKQSLLQDQNELSKQIENLKKSNKNYQAKIKDTKRIGKTAQF